MDERHTLSGDYTPEFQRFRKEALRILREIDDGIESPEALVNYLAEALRAAVAEEREKTLLEAERFVDGMGLSVARYAKEMLDIDLAAIRARGEQGEQP